MAYLPIIELLKQNFQIAPSDGDRTSGKSPARHWGLGADLAANCPYLLHLLAVEAEGVSAAGSPEMVKRKTFEALQMLMLESAARRPLMLTIEDLHWVDTTTKSASLSCSSTLLAPACCSCTRTGQSSSPRGRASPTTVSSLCHASRPGEPPDAQRCLAQIEDDLTALIVEKAEGVPFFSRNWCKSLQETGAIERHEGQWRLTARPRRCRSRTRSKKCSWPVSTGCRKRPKVCSRLARSWAVSFAGSSSGDHGSRRSGTPGPPRCPHRR